MPHYADGQKAEYFDEVKGKNVMGREITGVVVGIVPGSDLCNLSVAHTVRRTIQAHDPKTGQFEVVGHYPATEISTAMSKDCTKLS